MYGQTLSVTLSIGKNGRKGILPVHKGIVLGNASITVNTVYLAIGLVQLLSLLFGTPVSNAEIQIPFLIKNNSAAIMIPCCTVGLMWCLVNHLLIDPRMVFDPSTDNACHGRTAPGIPLLFQTMAISQVNPAIFFILRIDGHIHQASL